MAIKKSDLYTSLWASCDGLLAERYAAPLPQIEDEVAALAAKVDADLKKMGVKA